MKSTLIYLLATTLLATGCYTTTYQTNQNANSNQAKRRPLPDIVYSIDQNNDGNFTVIEIEEEKRPQPTQGKDQWIRDFYGKLKYPAVARENGIGGIVILDIEFDQSGKVTQVGIKKSVSTECDEEAKKAYINSTQQGYSPLIINNVPVKFRMELPVGFWLE